MDLEAFRAKVGEDKEIVLSVEEFHRMIDYIERLKAALAKCNEQAEEFNEEFADE